MPRYRYFLSIGVLLDLIGHLGGFGIFLGIGTPSGLVSLLSFPQKRNTSRKKQLQSVRASYYWYIRALPSPQYGVRCQPKVVPGSFVCPCRPAA